MVLEATMICVDNSEWMRNGDYALSRLQAQADAVNLLCGGKTQSNPENTVGVIAMAGRGGARVLATPTDDLGKLLACTHGRLEVGGEADLAASIQVAQLALKHRQNKRQRQRIVAFVGSPVMRHDKKTLEAIGRNLKKNNVALDVVDFGDESDDGKAEKLEALVAAANGGGGGEHASHIVHVPPPGDDGDALADVLLRTSIFTGEELGTHGSGFAASASAAGFEFGVDPNVDPELALALRLSMEEERARQEAAASKRAAEQGSHGSSSNSDSAMDDAEPAASNAGDDDDDVLQEALAMSMESDAAASGISAAMAEDGALGPVLVLPLRMPVEDWDMSSDDDSDTSEGFEEEDTSSDSDATDEVFEED